jgi:hypothetical protein
MNVKRTKLTFANIQIKSEECFKRFAKAVQEAVQEIEEQTGVHEVEICIENIFFCPWINLDNCQNTEMEKLLIRLIDKLKINGKGQR